MAFAETLTKDEPVVIYRTDGLGAVDLDSVIVVGLTDRNPRARARVYFKADLGYHMIRAELLRVDKFNPQKSPISIPQANKLRVHLREKYQVTGLEGELTEEGE